MRQREQKQKRYFERVTRICLLDRGVRAYLKAGSERQPRGPQRGGSVSDLVSERRRLVLSAFRLQVEKCEIGAPIPCRALVTHRHSAKAGRHHLLRPRHPAAAAAQTCWGKSGMECARLKVQKGVGYSSRQRQAERQRSVMAAYMAASLSEMAARARCRGVGKNRRLKCLRNGI
jgi:hypothetical protein